MIILELRPGSVTTRQRGGALLPLPRSGSRSGCRQTRTTSGGGTGGLRITVVANPPGNQPSRDHRSSCTPKPVELPVERAGPSTRGVPAVSLVLLPMTGCRSLHRRVSWSFLGKRFGCAAATAVAMPESDPESRLALGDMHEGGHDPEVLKELCTTSGLALTSDEGHCVVFGSCDCPHLWSRSVTWLCLVDMGMPTKFGSSRALCPRLASSAMQSRAWPSSSRLLRSRLRRSNTSSPARRRGRPLRPSLLPHRIRSSLQKRCR